MTVYGQITFDAAGTEPRFQCEQEDGRQTIRIGGSPLAVMVSVTGTPVELADYADRILKAIRWPDVTVVSDRWAPGPKDAA